MSSDCGIGTPQGYTGPCNGHYPANDAGAGVFAGVHSAPVVGAVVACGALVAVLLFAVFVSRSVGGFFSERKRLARERAREGSSPLFSVVVAEHQAGVAARAAASSSSGDANDLDTAGDTELDQEDDRESEVDEQEWESDSPAARQKFQ